MPVLNEPTRISAGATLVAIASVLAANRDDVNGRKQVMHSDCDIEAFLGFLHLETLESTRFRGVNHDVGTGTLFGGQVLSQAIIAASSTVENRLIHSLHACFLRPGSLDAPIDYIVERDRDGRSFSARRLVATQRGQAIFTMAASFQVPERGLEHQVVIPDVTAPETIAGNFTNSRNDEQGLVQTALEAIDHFGPFEFRRVLAYDPLNPKKQPPLQQVWFRLNGELPDDSAVHRALLAFASDTQIIRTATLPHGISWADGKLKIVSLDHAMWFRTDFRLGGWYLYACDSPASGAGRGFARGMIFDRGGILLANTVQEGLLRAQLSSSPGRHIEKHQTGETDGPMAKEKRG